MLFLNLPDYKLGIEQRFREAVEPKASKPLPLLKKILREEMVGTGSNGWGDRRMEMLMILLIKFFILSLNCSVYLEK